MSLIAVAEEFEVTAEVNDVLAGVSIRDDSVSADVSTRG